MEKNLLQTKEMDLEKYCLKAIIKAISFLNFFDCPATNLTRKLFKNKKCDIFILSGMKLFLKALNIIFSFFSIGTVVGYFMYFTEITIWWKLALPFIIPTTIFVIRLLLEIIEKAISSRLWTIELQEKKDKPLIRQEA